MFSSCHIGWSTEVWTGSHGNLLKTTTCKQLWKLHFSFLNILNELFCFLSVRTSKVKLMQIHIHFSACRCTLPHSTSLLWTYFSGQNSTWLRYLNIKCFFAFAFLHLFLVTVIRVLFHLHAVIWLKLPWSHVNRLLSCLTLPSITGFLRVLWFSSAVTLDPWGTLRRTA